MNKEDINAYKRYIESFSLPTNGRTLETFFVEFDKTVKIGKTTDFISIEFVGLNTMDSNLTDKEIKKMIAECIKEYIGIHQPITKPIDKDDFMSYVFIQRGWIFEVDEINIYSVNVAVLKRDSGGDKKGGDGKGPKNPPLCNYNLIVFPKESAEEKENPPAVEPPSIEI